MVKQEERKAGEGSERERSKRGKKARKKQKGQREKRRGREERNGAAAPKEKTRTSLGPKRCHGTASFFFPRGENPAGSPPARRASVVP